MFFPPGFLHRLYRVPELAVVASTIVVAAAFTAVYPAFLSASTLVGILTAASLTGIVGIAAAFLLISGEFDLSVGGTYGVSAMVLGYLISISPEYSVVALLASLGLGSLIGFVNGFVTTKLRVPSFITTLGMLFFLNAVALFLTQGVTIKSPAVPLLFVLNGPIGPDFRTSVIWFVVIAVIFWVILNKTRYGNYTYATGGNKNVAQAMGINPGKVKLQNFILVGFCAALGGAVSLGRYQMAQMQTGTGTELVVIVAAVIGGCSLFGGYGSPIGAAVGIFMLTMVNVGLVITGAPPFWYQAFVGLILVIASIINLWVFSKR
jgi:simple sugar transport system permease protein